MRFTVRPRAKNAGSPVVLTVEVLREFFHVPRSAAAVMLKISETSLKKACRVLGVETWPHTRRKSMRAASADTESIVERVADESAEECAESPATSAEECAEECAESIEFSPDIFFNNEMF
jgi:hypothetical protein